MANSADNPISCSALGELYLAEASVPIDGHDISVEIPYERLRVSEPDVAAIAAAASNVRAIAVAAELAAAIASERGAKCQDAIYVVAPEHEPICKIGITSEPLNRLRQFQIGSPERLRVHSLYWAMDGSAKGLDALCMKVAKSTAPELHGGWIGMSPEAASQLIATVVAMVATPFADSAMWVRNRSRLLAARQTALADHEESLLSEVAGPKQLFGHEIATHRLFKTNH